MALTIISTPTDPPVPTPVSDCFQFCFQPDDADIFDTPGVNALVEVIFPSTISTIPANGTQFTIWGKLFTVDNGQAYSSNSFKVESSGNATGANFRNMLKANYFFSRSTDVSAGASLRETLITWLACGEQDYFSGANMDMAELTGIGATVTVINGTTPVVKTGAMVQVQLLKCDGASNVYSPITMYEGITPTGTCGTAEELCVDFMADIRKTLFTPMPDLSLTSEIDPEETTMVAKFKINSGVTWIDDTCTAQSGVFTDSDEFMAIDIAFPPEDNIGMRRFVFDHPENFGFNFPILCPQFMTNQPRYHTIGENSFAWLWLSGGYQSLSPSIINVRFNVFYADGTTDHADVSYDPTQEFKVHCFNVSPKRLLSLFSLTDLDNVVKYFVTATADLSGATLGTETYFVLDRSCENVTDLYFKTPYGGIGTLLCEVIEKETRQEGTEICLNTACATSRFEAAKYGGRMLNNLRSYETITLRARRNYSDEEVEFFRSMKASPERWIQVEQYGEVDYGGEWMAKRFNVEPGGIRIFKQGQYVDLEVTGYVADTPIQSPRGV